jgi:hypothetical protein
MRTPALRDSEGRLLRTQRQFRCRCDLCKSVRPPVYNHPRARNLPWHGKLWQARYFEPQAEFLRRVREWHRTSGPQADAHVQARDRHLGWCADQWALSNGLTVVAECGTILNNEEDPR